MAIAGEKQFYIRRKTLIADKPQVGNVADGSADNVTLPDLPELRQRSRDLLRNAPLACGAVNTVFSNVVGTGLKVQSHLDRDVLKIISKTKMNLMPLKKCRAYFATGQKIKIAILRAAKLFLKFKIWFCALFFESGDIFYFKRYVRATK